jgi:lysozyme family protein
MESITSQSFVASLPFILRWEGGFVDDPNDHGGRTNKGVTQNVYNAWRADQRSPQQDVKQINDQEVAAIYYHRYWQPSKCDELRRKLDLAAFDTAVNMGPNRAIKVLQGACDRVPDPHREFAGQLPVRRRGVEVSLVGERRTGKHKLDVP